jgi:hypothetical protein
MDRRGGADGNDTENNENDSEPLEHEDQQLPNTSTLVH